MERKPTIVLAVAGLAWALATHSACDNGAKRSPSAVPEAEPEPAGETRAASQAAPPTLAADQLHVDAAREPRDGGPLIAGEAIRVGMHLTGGVPPYRVSLSVPAIQADPAEVPTHNSVGVELAVGGVLSPDTASGTHRITVTITDTTGATARADSAPFEVIGQGAALEPTPGGVPPFIVITDAASRRRTSFVRGETVNITATLGSGVGGTATFRFRAPSGTVLSKVARLEIRKGVVTVPLFVPRLALAGDYRVEIAAGYLSASVPLRVRGKPFAPAAALAIDSLTLRGGTDLRTPRAGVVQRGETLVIEARVGGAHHTVTATLRLRDNRGKLIAEQQLGTSNIEAAPGARAATSRVFVGGEWQVPASVATGNYRIEIEVTEQDDVSARYREVLIR